jgi:hypothetical protein
MTFRLLVVAALASGSLLAQEGRKIPDDSVLVSLQGCATNRTFIVGPRSEHAPRTLEIEPGRRFRLNGPKDVLEKIKQGEGRMVEVTGLIRKADLAKPGGIGLAGGRVRIGGAAPRAPVGNSPMADAVYNQAVMDVETSRPLPDSCPAL